MTLRRVQILYYIAAISIAVILVSAADEIGWVTAVIVLVGARPLFRAVSRTTKAATLHDVELLAHLMAEQPENGRQPQQRQD